MTTTRRTRKPKAAPAATNGHSEAPESEAPQSEPEVHEEPEAHEEPSQEEPEHHEDDEPHDEAFEGPGGQLRRELWGRGQELFDGLERLQGDDVKEAVHNVRVASRRLGSILGLAAELIGSKPVRSVRTELSEIRRALGEVRDLQIQREFLEEVEESLPEVQGRLEELRAREPKAIKKAVRQLEKAKPRKMARRLEGLDALIAALVESSDGWEGCLEMLNRATAERFVQVLHQRDQTDRNDPVSTHILRVAFKKFRYRAEVVGQFQERSEDHRDAMRAVQKALGGLQDVEVITRGLEHYWIQHPPEREGQLAVLSHLWKRRKSLLKDYDEAIEPLAGMWELPPSQEAAE